MAVTAETRKWIRTLSKRDHAIALALLEFAMEVRCERNTGEIERAARKRLDEINALFEVSK